VVIRYVKHQRRLQITHQNNPPPSIPKPPVNKPIQLAIEAAGVVGILPADLIDEEQQHKQQTNINIGAICCIFFIIDLENKPNT
jgi:hypothetical protein